MKLLTQPMAGSTKSFDPAKALKMFGKFHDKEDNNTGLIINDRYWLQHLIGIGGMGRVYTAIDRNDDSEVVLKIREKRTFKRVCKKRITSEINALQMINHKNLVTLKDAGTYHNLDPAAGVLQEVAYEVMELMVGMDLGEFLSRQGVMTWHSIKSIIGQTCEGLDAMHTNNIIHHDVKPDNIFITSDGIVKLFDFDLSKFNHLDFEDDYIPGTIFGTMNYMSPEKLDGMLADHRSDIFSMGVILYEMLTGALPFSGKRLLEIALKIKKMVPPPVKLIAPGGNIPRGAQQIVSRALEKDPDKRYQSASDMREDILNISSSMPEVSPIRIIGKDEGWLEFVARMSTMNILGQDTAPMDTRQIRT